MNRNTRSPSRRDVLIATGAVSLSALVPRELLAAEGDEKPLLGSYKHSGGDKDREARDQAIDDVVAGMNIVSRTIARLHAVARLRRRRVLG